MSGSRTLLTLTVALAVVAAGCSEGDEDEGASDGNTGRESGDHIPDLPALHAELDPVGGGRIVDARGREVLLRGVNVNALGEYWQYGRFPPTFPLIEQDAGMIADLGWNVVRLVVSWSRVEPEPGEYDEAYLDAIRDAVRLFEGYGIYTIIDFHQDAWGATLAARPGEQCADGTLPALGWDGAPGWATLDGGASRCVPANIRELSPAVMAAFDAFWNDAPGPGGIGIRSRYVDMLGRVAEQFASETAVAGYDVMNEPHVLGAEHLLALSELYGDAMTAIRAAEERADGFPHLVLFEPSITWSDLGTGTPPDFPHDDNIVFAPHIYRGALTPGPVERSDFERARADAATFGGAPVLVGEWGSTPRNGPDNPGFRDHQALQDEFHYSSTLWTWRESCGDPHQAAAARDGRTRFGGLFEVDCDTDETVGPRRALMRHLTRPYVRAAPGALVETFYDPASGAYEAVGTGADGQAELLVWYPTGLHDLGPITTEGFPNGVDTRPARSGGVYLTGVPDGRWTLTVGRSGAR